MLLETRSAIIVMPLLKYQKLSGSVSSVLRSASLTLEL